MPDEPSAQDDRALPPGLDVLWGRRGPGRRGPKGTLTVEAIVEAAVALADADGLDAVSMAAVAKRLGYTTMSLYRYVTGKDELLALMWNASAQGAESLMLSGRGWRARLREWTTIQRDMIDRHPWITQLPMATPPMAPNSLAFVEIAMATLHPTGLRDAEKMRIIGLLSSFTLSEARMAHDARRAAHAATEQAATEQRSDEAQASPEPPASFEAVLQLVVDPATYPHLHRMAWAAEPAPPDEYAAFLAGVDTILDGVQVAVDRAKRR